VWSSAGSIPAAAEVVRRFLGYDMLQKDSHSCSGDVHCCSWNVLCMLRADGCAGAGMCRVGQSLLLSSCCTECCTMSGLHVYDPLPAVDAARRVTDCCWLFLPAMIYSAWQHVGHTVANLKAVSRLP
jgi:hypothetical protein